MKITEARPLFSRHFVALCSLFILGNAVITLPLQKADKFTFLGFLISFLIGIVLYFIVFCLPLSKPVLCIAFLISFWAAADTFLDILNFINKTLLEDSMRILIVIPLIFTVIFLFIKGKTALFKFSLISFCFTVLAVVFFFIFTAKDFEIKNIIIKTLPSAKNLCFQSLPYFKIVTLPSLLLGFFAKQTKNTRSSAFLGYIFGNIMLAACILNSVLLFGSNFSGRLSFPYASAISTVTFGSLFTRMDGFAYFIYFASCVIKITVCVNIIASTVKEFRDV